MAPPPVLIGNADFLKQREADYLYVDKSRFISEVLARPAEVQLYPRPRRFGKTLSMSMLRYFLEIGPDRSDLFSDLAVWQDPLARQHFQKHAVIFLSFRAVRGDDWASTRGALQRVVQRELERLEPLWSAPAVNERLVRRLSGVMEGLLDEQDVLEDLSRALFLATGERVALLIDEYDGPLLHAWAEGHYDQVVGWFRAFLTSGLKDNHALLRGVLTGILRIAKESMFSGLNNVRVYSLLARDQELFGFTEAEVNALLHQYGRDAEAEDIRRWYNGYRFGDSIVYNPWSILHVLHQPLEPLKPHWLNSSDNALVHKLLLQSGDLHKEITTLIQGGTIEREVDENVALRDLRGENVWGMLLFSGYLNAIDRREGQDHLLVTLAIPNREVLRIWRNTFVRKVKDDGGKLEPLHHALLTGNAEEVQELLKKLLFRHVSSHDVKETQDKAFYHAFVLGLLVTMENSHAVRSNREVGIGRADVQLIPKRPGLPGVVLEFKRKSDKRTLNYHAGAALKQISAQGYCAELEAAGAVPIYRLGISFSGKEVVVRG